MDFDLAPQERDWAESCAALARARIAPGAEERNESGKFDRNLWRDVGKAGLHGLTLPKTVGGAGLGYLPFALALEAFAREGDDLGFALSWMIHSLICDFQIARRGGEAQRRAFLPKLLSGEHVAAFAVSEPETGANPKFLACRAERRGDRFVLNGTKTFVTNGPVADVLVVFAVTGEAPGGRKAISALLVPTTLAGVERTPMALPMARTSPHATIAFKDVAVAAANLLGPEGEAYEVFVKPIRALEDSFACALLAGHAARTLDRAREHLRKADAAAEAAPAVGRMAALGGAMRMLAFKSAWLRDRGRAEGAELDETLFAYSEVAGGFAEALEEGLAARPPKEGGALARAVGDIRLGQVGRGAERARLRQHGERLLGLR